MVGCFDKDKLVSIDSYWFWGDGLADIGIVTYPDYREKGIGKALISYLCNYGFKLDRINVYRHNEKNLASRNLALSLNFEQKMTIETTKILKKQKGDLKMKIGIIVYSQTGNTYSVVEKVKEELTNKGHEVKIKRLEPLDQNDVHPGAKNIRYKDLPELEKYDGYIFASPVQAFSLAAGMESYLNKEIESLDNKTTACVLTKGLPFNWTGGNRAMKQLKDLVESKNGDVVETGIIKWLSFNRKKKIRKIAEKMGKTF